METIELLRQQREEVAQRLAKLQKELEYLDESISRWNSSFVAPQQQPIPLLPAIKRRHRKQRPDSVQARLGEAAVELSLERKGAIRTSEVAAAAFKMGIYPNVPATNQVSGLLHAFARSNPDKLRILHPGVFIAASLQ